MAEKSLCVDNAALKRGATSVYKYANAADERVYSGLRGSIRARSIKINSFIHIGKSIVLSRAGLFRRLLSLIFCIVTRDFLGNPFDIGRLRMEQLKA